MSAATGDQTPNQRQSVDPSQDHPSGKTMFNSWTENKKIKTCKCTVCDGRVRASSQKCNGCGRHVCSDCLDPGSNKDGYYKAAAKNRIEVGCWACNWRSNMNPAFANRKPAPEVRTDEERRARASKALGARRKVTAQASGSKSAATESAEDAEDAAAHGHRDAYEYDEGEALVLEVQAMSARSSSEHINRKRDLEAVLCGSELVESSSVAKAAKKSTEPSAPRAFDKTFTKPTTLTGSSSATEESHRSDYSATMPPSSTTSADEGVRLPHEFLEGCSTVIVGAGVVGLFIAYELATKLKEYHIKHDITVVEIHDQDKGVFSLASGMCAGVLGASGMPEQWSRGILGLARSYWHELFNKDDFSTSGVQIHTHPLIERDNEDIDIAQHVNTPSWYHGQEDRALGEDPEAFAQINSKALGSWLFEKCQELGVQFKFDHYVERLEFSIYHFPNNVYLRDRKSESEEPVRLACSNFVLAAGPFTTRIFNNLFKRSTLRLGNDVQRVHTLHVLQKEATDSDYAAIRLPSVAEDFQTIEDEVKIALAQDGKPVVLSAISSKIRPVNLGLNIALAWEKSRCRGLRAVAREYLNPDSEDVKPGQKLLGRTGRSLVISTANKKNPITAKVPPSALGRVVGGDVDEWETGVWLCYGFGAHGTTLAPGAARILVSNMMFGNRKTEVSNFGFTLPAYRKTTATEVLARMEQGLPLYD